MCSLCSRGNLRCWDAVDGSEIAAADVADFFISGTVLLSVALDFVSASPVLPCSDHWLSFLSLVGGVDLRTGTEPLIPTMLHTVRSGDDSAAPSQLSVGDQTRMCSVTVVGGKFKVLHALPFIPLEEAGLRYHTMGVRCLCVNLLGSCECRVLLLLVNCS